MAGFFGSFRRLRWKLTASYTLVTVVALVTVELLLLGAELAFLREAVVEAPGLLAREVAGEVAPQLRPYLSGEEPDAAGIARWLRNARGAGVRATNGEALLVTAGPWDLRNGTTRLLVLDPAGRVLGDAHRAGRPGPPMPLNADELPGMGAVLPRALAGERDAGRLYARTDDGRLAIAAPVLDAGGRVIGALALAGPFFPEPRPFGRSVALVAASALLFTLAAGAIGALVGFFTARGLTRRLDQLAAAATAWSEGDFSRTIRDRSSDELGVLSRRLDAMASQLEGLLRARQQLSVSGERNRLARELHDSVKQQVFAISMNLGGAEALWERDPAEARRAVRAALELARHSQRELTAIIGMLRPVGLEGKGLPGALEEYVERWRRQTGIGATVGVEGEPELPLEVEEAFFRVVQEALANAARHSRASSVGVELRTAGEAAELRIRDDGEGFDPGEASLGVGLRSMRERMEAIGGELRVESDAGGTLVATRAPLRETGRDGR
jgi:NarL family two-component system sensor histidine kinase LiaS